jgi:hypothetical protein
MPIEDVQYLREHGEAESHVLYIDSSKRDVDLYPRPNQYVLHFDEPFRNVFGLQILEANIPRTMYSIEVDRRDLFCDVGYNGMHVADAGGATKHVRLQARDHDMTTLRTALNDAFQSSETFGATLPRISVSFLTDRPQFSSRFVFTCRTPFLVDFDRSNIAQELGFDQKADGGLYQVQDGQLNYECFRHNALGQRIFASVDTGDKPLHEQALPPPDPASARAVSLADSPLAPRALHITSDVDVDGEMFTHSVLSAVEIPLLQTPATPSVDMELVDTTTGVLLLRAELHAGQGADGAPVLRVRDLHLSPLHTCVLETDRQYALRLGADADATLLADDAGAFACRVWTSFSTHRLVSPGIVALTGERFVILRIQEIEDHLHGSLAYSSATHAGMALFSIGNDTVSLLRNRLDFVNLNYRQFHPIGKLSRLTLSFTTGDGRPYDFKNVNHYMLIVVRYLQPKARQHLQRSLLNPDYNPDFMAYMTDAAERRRAAAADDDDASSVATSDPSTTALHDRDRLLQLEREYDEDDGGDGDGGDDDDDEMDDDGGYDPGLYTL